MILKFDWMKPCDTKHDNYAPVTLVTHGRLNYWKMASNSRTEFDGGVMGLFVLINTTLLAYKQLSRHNDSNGDFIC